MRHQMCGDIADGLVRVDARDLECNRRSHARFNGVCDRVMASLGAARDCERIDELVCDECYRRLTVRYRFTELANLPRFNPLP